MKIEILKEAGYEEALLGLSLNKNQPLERMPQVLHKLATHDGGHNKALESIHVWIDITAPRYWWSEFDTYRVGTSKQSESTMHTITKRLLTKEDFEMEDVTPTTLAELNSLINAYNYEAQDKDEKDEFFFALKRKLPEGFLQRRVVSTNYKSLRNIYQQRKTHKLPEWDKFCSYVEKMLMFGEWLR